MDEIVALESAKQKDFVKSVRGLKKLLKKKGKKPQTAEVFTEKQEVTKERKSRRKNRGLVYLSHIPHGFYEQQMTEYFKQFGVVTNSRVIRSKRTGNSRGFAFVEFKEPAVAEIVAETMNNYLMGKRLLKAVYIPPHKQRIHAMRKKWNTQNNPASEERLKFKKMLNADKSVDQELKIANKLLSNLSNTKKKLSDLGIDYDFFRPVDIPEGLQENIDIKSEENIKPDLKLKTELKSEDQKIKEKIKIEPTNVVTIETKVTKKKQKKQKENNKSNSNDNLKDTKELVNSDKGKLNKENNVQKKKEKKLKQANVKGPKNFVSIKNSDDSDSSIDFDSDEFETVIKDDDEDNISSDDESETRVDDEANISSDDEGESEDEDKKPELPKKGSKMSAQGSRKKNVTKLHTETLEKQNKTNLQTQPIKRKNIQSEAPVSVKKTKFEKQNSKRPQKKMIKKRK